MNIRPFEISQPAGMSCTYGVVEEGANTEIPKILVVSFSGTYPDGSLGNRHGHYIAASTVHGLAHLDPWCVILDFRELHYQWGNTLLLVFDYIERFMSADEGDPDFPVVVITSEKCQDAFLSLTTPSHGRHPEWHFNDVDAAIEYAIQQANEWIDA